MEKSEMATPEFLSKEEVELLKRSLLQPFSEDEKESFVRTCQRTRLDPFTRPPQIYATRRVQKVYENGEERKVPVLVIITSIQGATAIADRTGKYDGCEISWCGEDGEWRDKWLEADPPAAARCIVYHKDRTHPEIAIARWKSYKGEQYDSQIRAFTLTPFWKKMDDYMLGKCSKMAALRGAFPNQLGGLYLSEELESDIMDTESTQLPKGLKPEQVKFIDSEKPLNDDSEKAELQAERAREVAQGIADRGQPPPSASPQQAAPPAAQPAAQSPTVPATGETGAAPEPEVPAWAEHVILGIKDQRFNGRKVKDLTPVELSKIAQQWVPKVRAQWEDASEEQQADAIAIEAAAAARLENIV